MKIKLILLTLMILLGAGCISKEEDYMDKIDISTDAFKNGEMIPDEFTCKGKDISPSLSWKGIPENTVSISLIMEDPDAPGGTFIHWVMYNIPARTTGLPKGVPGSPALDDGIMQGMTDFGQPGYGDPCPPSGKPHRYYFRIYALDMKLDLPQGASKSQVEEAMQEHILAKGEIMGKYGT